MRSSRETPYALDVADQPTNRRTADCLSDWWSLPDSPPPCIPYPRPPPTLLARHTTSQPFARPSGERPADSFLESHHLHPSPRFHGFFPFLLFVEIPREFAACFPREADRAVSHSDLTDGLPILRNTSCRRFTRVLWIRGEKYFFFGGGREEFFARNSRISEIFSRNHCSVVSLMENDRVSWIFVWYFCKELLFFVSYRERYLYFSIL